jgi:hypothetical protein
MALEGMMCAHRIAIGFAPRWKRLPRRRDFLWISLHLTECGCIESAEKLSDSDVTLGLDFGPYFIRMEYEETPAASSQIQVESRYCRYSSPNWPSSLPSSRCRHQRVLTIPAVPISRLRSAP